MKYLCILALLISSLACAIQSALPVAENDHTQTPAPTDTTAPELSRIVGSWNLRKEPGGEVITTITDVEVSLYDCKPYEGGMWCKVQFGGVTGWVNKRGLE